MSRGLPNFWKVRGAGPAKGLVRHVLDPRLCCEWFQVALQGSPKRNVVPRSLGKSNFDSRPALSG